MPEHATYDYDTVYRTTLAKGAHSSPDEELCLMELTAMFAREQHTDHPKCVSPVLGEFGRNLNDTLPDDLRQELKGLIPSLPGTAGDGWDESRSYMALDWLIRTWLPTWLELSPRCREDARRIRDLGRIVDLVSAERAGAIVRPAGRNAAAARDAARDAAGAAAWVATRVAAGAAAGDAAGAAARDAAWVAARDAAAAAAGAAAGDAAGAAARDATGAAAWAATRDATRDAAWDAAWAAAWAATRDAARDFLTPTVRVLQLSAIDLFAEMIKNPWSGPEDHRS